MQGIPHMSVKRRVTAFVKLGFGAAVATVNRQCRFEQAIFMIAHMRCGSTALSNILCGRQSRRAGDQPGAPERVEPTGASPFRQDTAFALRRSRRCGILPVTRNLRGTRPVESILSIRNLFARISRGEYATDAAAATYYGERMLRLLSMWDHFPQQNRIGLTHRLLTMDPKGQLERISSFLRLRLARRWKTGTPARVGGGGDPFSVRSKKI
jgi:hypothetical protein